LTGAQAQADAVADAAAEAAKAEEGKKGKGKKAKKLTKKEKEEAGEFAATSEQRRGRCSKRPLCSHMPMATNPPSSAAAAEAAAAPYDPLMGFGTAIPGQLAAIAEIQEDLKAIANVVPVANVVQRLEELQEKLKADARNNNVVIVEQGAELVVLAESEWVKLSEVDGDIVGMTVRVAEVKEKMVSEKKGRATSSIRERGAPPLFTVRACRF